MSSNDQIKAERRNENVEQTYMEIDFTKENRPYTFAGC